MACLCFVGHFPNGEAIRFSCVGHHRICPRSASLREKRGGGHPHKPPPRSRHHRETKMKKSQSSPTQLAQASTSDDEGEEEAALTSLHSLSIQLLDLMHTLHTRAASIFAAWAQEGSENNGGGKPIDAATGTLWATCWCPLLQGQSPLAVLNISTLLYQALSFVVDVCVHCALLVGCSCTRVTPHIWQCLSSRLFNYFTCI